MLFVSTPVLVHLAGSQGLAGVSCSLDSELVYGVNEMCSCSPV